MNNSIIEVRNISKKYKIGFTQPYYALRDVVTGLFNTPINIFKSKKNTKNNSSENDFWALKDVSFNVSQGEIVGIIGPNGAGKSTLLKILSRITPPTTGEIKLRGRVASLLEVGTGFHPELTGRENIFLNGSVLGMKRSEIKKKFNEIVEFAEIEKFLDTPVKHYSSGMYMRLAFSVAAHLEPEILLVDEVLAVGDANFQKKSLGKMEEVTKKEGRTILFVSHNMGAIQSLCKRCILLKKGEISFDGSVTKAIDKYLSMDSNARSSAIVLEDRPDLPLQVRKIWIENAKGQKIAEAEMGNDVILKIEYVVKYQLIGASVAALVSTEGMPLMYSYDVDINDRLAGIRKAGKYLCTVKLPMSMFKEGLYTISLYVGYDRQNITDPNAAILLTLVNNNIDTTHKSYRKDRPGFIYKEISWITKLQD